VEAGLIPICVKTCPTGAMSFGEREEMVARANNRLGVVKKEFPEASLLDADSVRVIYLITHKRDLYHNNAMREEKSRSASLA